MSFINKKIAATISTIVLGASLATGVINTASAAEAQKLDTNKVYKVGIENGYYPYEYYDKQGNFVGYDVDVINLVCKKLDIKCELVKGQFDALIPNLLYRKTDMVISSLSITQERKRKVAFSLSYVPPQPAVYIAKDDTKNTDPNKLTVIGVQQGTTLAQYLYSINDNGNFRVITYPSFDTAMLDLKSGRVQAVFESLDTSSSYLNNPESKVKVIGKYVYSPIVTEGTGIAFRKSQTFLRSQVDKVILELRADGTLAKLRQKYGIKVNPQAEELDTNQNLPASETK